MIRQKKFVSGSRSESEINKLWIMDVFLFVWFFGFFFSLFVCLFVFIFVFVCVFAFAFFSVFCFVLFCFVCLFVFYWTLLHKGTQNLVILVQFSFGTPNWVLMVPVITDKKTNFFDEIEFRIRWFILMNRTHWQIGIFSSSTSVLHNMCLCI